MIPAANGCLCTYSLNVLRNGYVMSKKERIQITEGLYSHDREISPVNNAANALVHPHPGHGL